VDAYSLFTCLEYQFIRLNTEDFPQKTEFSWELGAEGSDGILRLYGLHEAKLSQITAAGTEGRKRRLTICLRHNKPNCLQNKSSSAFLMDCMSILLTVSGSITHTILARQSINYQPHARLRNRIGSAKTLITTDPQAAKAFFHTAEECYHKDIK